MGKHLFQNPPKSPLFSLVIYFISFLTHPLYFIYSIYFQLLNRNSPNNPDFRCKYIKKIFLRKYIDYKLLIFMMLCRFFDYHLINVGKHLGMMKGKREQGERGGTPAHGASIRCGTGRHGRNRRDA